MKDDDTKLYTKIYEGLSNLKLDGVNKIIIENQPALKNPKMKSVQLFIYTYFFCKLKDGRFPELENVSFFNASKKLIKQDTSKDPAKDPSIKEQPLSEYQSYKKRKNDSIDIVKEFLKDMEDWEKYFNSHPKKDDLADSLLQGVMYFSIH